MAEYINRESVRPDDFCVGISCQDCPFLKDPIKGGCRADDFIMAIPAADVQSVTHCKDCVYRPYYEPSDSKSVSDLVFPDYRFNPCPCRVEDVWYSWMPDDDWFCAYGKRKGGET